MVGVLAQVEEGEDEDWEANLEEDPEKVKDFDKATKLYSDLRREQRRADIYERNLQKKLKQLKADLDCRTEEVEGLQRNLKLELRKHEDEHASVQRERERKYVGQEERIRGQLAEVLYAKPPPGNKRVIYEVDTVLVSFLRPVDNFRYNLAFRVDGRTSVIELRGSACRYWDVSSDEYVLKTMAGNKCQDAILVTKCFRQGEIAQLRLEVKQRQASERPTDDELKAIQPKVHKGQHRRRPQRDGYDADVDKVQKQQDNHALELRRMGGVYFLLKVREKKASEHVSKIKLRDIIMYIVLTCLTFYVYYLRRPAGEDYWFIHGIQEQLVRETPMPGSLTSVPSFTDVATREEVWDWLGMTLPSLLWDRSVSGLRAYNTLFGYVAIRAQNVKFPESPDAECKNNKKVVQKLRQKGGACYSVAIDSDTAERRDFVAVQAYWEEKLRAQAKEQVDARLRGPTPPWSWASADHNRNEHNIADLTGVAQSYDASGYTVEYKMNVGEEKILEYQRDMLEFRRPLAHPALSRGSLLGRTGWISLATRAVIVSFTAYNFDYDKWVACELIFEMPTSAAVKTRLLIQPFQPRIMETRVELVATYIDYVRVVLAVYIGIFVGIAERHHKIKNHKAGCWYHLSLNGICDLGAVACILCVTAWRASALNGSSTGELIAVATDSGGTRGFYSFTRMASAYLSIFCVEGILMVFLCFRLLSFFRLNRTVFLLWHAIGRAMHGVAYITALFLPTVLGVVWIAHAVYGPYLKEYMLISTTLLQIYNLMEGKLDVKPIMERDAFWAMLIMLFSYIAISFILLNAFLAIAVNSYYVVRLTRGLGGEHWSTTRKIRWALPGLLVSIFQALMAPAGPSEPPH